MHVACSVSVIAGKGISQCTGGETQNMAKKATQKTSYQKDLTRYRFTELRGPPAACVNAWKHKVMADDVSDAIQADFPSAESPKENIKKLKTSR